MSTTETHRTATRTQVLDMAPRDFRTLGHAVVDRLADHLESLRDAPVTPGETVTQVRAALDAARSLPARGESADVAMREAMDLVLAHSLFDGHPRFWGYVIGSPSPVGALADLVAASVNPNLGGWAIAPIATEIELQSVRWIAELIGYPSDTGGILTSGGNAANFVGFLAALHGARGTKPLVYASSETHTWIDKAVDLFGLGADACRSVPLDAERRMDASALERMIAEDRARRDGRTPCVIVGTAGTVSTGAIDPLGELHRIARANDLWLHVDGAYGAVAALLPEASEDLRALALADSVAVDPHKWLYAPIEAGCALVRSREALHATFAHRPPYYPQDDGPDAPVNLHEYGMQNSRHFRALKVWLNLRCAGRAGYEEMVGADIAHARRLYDAMAAHPDMEACTLSLSIATFRYVPRALRARASEPAVAERLDALNRELLARVQRGGEYFVTNAVLDGRFVLRACFVNFRTSDADVDAAPEVFARYGREVEATLP